MWSAYRGTIDDEYTAEVDAVADANATLAGKWGPLVWDACLTASADGVLAAVVINVRDASHGFTPLLAYALTAPWS